MEPITRKEKFLAKAGGKSVKTPEPITREEMFLQKIAEKGSGSGGGGGSASIDVTAEVGQTIVVEEVDANGKPTKWKAADFPGGGKELVGEITITKESGSIAQEAKDNVVYYYTISWNEGVSAEINTLLSNLPQDRPLYVFIQIPGAGSFSVPASLIAVNGTVGLYYASHYRFIQADSGYGAHAAGVEIAAGGMKVDYILSDAIAALNYGLPMNLKIYALR